MSGREALTAESEALLRDWLGGIDGPFRDDIARIEAAAAREALPSVEEMTAALVRVGGLHTLSWVEYAEAVLAALRAARASDGGR